VNTVIAAPGSGKRGLSNGAAIAYPRATVTISQRSGGSCRPLPELDLESPLTTKALLVEDEVLIQDLIKDALEEAGFEVVTALDEAAAIARIQYAPEPFRAIITDVNLQKHGAGWNVATRGREANSKAAILYMTGDSEHDYASRGVPGSAILVKPFTPTQVVVAISHLLNSVNSQL